MNSRDAFRSAGNGRLVRVRDGAGSSRSNTSIPGRMSSPAPPQQREMVFCHECEDEWFRDEHGLTCPRCQSDFVEVVWIPLIGGGAVDEGGHDTVIARRRGSRHVSEFPALSDFCVENVLMSAPQIEANNNPHDFHAENDNDQWAPLGSPSPPGGMMHPFTHNNNHMGPFGFPFSNFATPQRANRNGGPEFHRAEYRTPGGGLVVQSFSYSSNTGASSGSGNRGNNSEQAQTTNSLADMVQGLLGNLLTARNTAASPSPGSPSPGSPPPGMPHPFLRPRNAHEPQQPHQVVDPLPNIMAQFFGPQAGVGQRSPGSPIPPHQHDEAELPTNLMGMMRMILSGHPMMMGNMGDAAYSQEEFDRIMSQLLEQAQQGGGEPPASSEEIARIPKITVDQSWLDRQTENKDCSICMEEAKLGDEVSELWCGHWYHPFCIKQWLDAHGACPLCRKTLRESREEWEKKNEKSARRERRRESRPGAGSSAHSETQDWHGYRNDDGYSGGSSSGGAGADGSSGGGIRDRLSSLFRGTSR